MCLPLKKIQCVIIGGDYFKGTVLKNGAAILNCKTGILRLEPATLVLIYRNTTAVKNAGNLFAGHRRIVLTTIQNA